MTTETLPARIDESGAAIMERVIITGDLGKLTPEERVTYYMRTCNSLGLNPLTKPFDYIVLNNKLTLYANRSAADQLRRIRGVSITDVNVSKVDDAFSVIVHGRDRDGREDVDVGYVNARGLTGEAVGNAMKKAVTQGKRRLTLSLVGLGWLDETEVETIPDARREDVDPETGEIRKPPTLAERAAAKAKEIAGPTDAPNIPSGSESDAQPASQATAPESDGHPDDAVFAAAAALVTGGCQWVLERGQERLVCGIEGEHDAHSWIDEALTKGGKVIRAEVPA